MKENLRDRTKLARTAFWHLRSGGIAGVREWLSRLKAEQGVFVSGNAQGANGFWAGRDRKKTLHFLPYELPAVGTGKRRPRVGVIADDFTRLAFSYEWELVELNPGSFSDQIERESLDFAFIESAWNGNSGKWKFQLSGENGPSSRFRELVQALNRSEIPFVFWNKEDPVHFDEFLPVAQMADFIFTTDGAAIPNYQLALGEDKPVAVLEFAVQPAVHNPVRPRHGWRSRDIMFAGMYFNHKYPERAAQLNRLLGAAKASLSTRNSRKVQGTGLEIFARHSSNPKHQFPPEWGSYVVGELSYPEMLTAYRAYRAMINVNSVVNSPTMFSRRMLEGLASGIPTISAPTPGLVALFGEQSPFLVESEELAQATFQAILDNPEFADRELHRAQRTLWDRHTYRERAARVEKAVGMTSESAYPLFSVLTSCGRPEFVERVFENVGRQRYPEVELILITHGFSLDPERIAELQRQYGVRRVQVESSARENSLGENLNRAIELSQGAYLSKMDDDDRYFAEYLSDLKYAFDYSGADIVGKQARYVYLERADVLVLKSPEREHKFTSMVAGPTITASREVFTSLMFSPVSQGEDTDFLARAREKGLKIYAADRYNFVQVRANHEHTWDVHDLDFLKQSEIVSFSPNLEAAQV